MKTFLDLVQEVLDPRLCHRCGGCVAFCTAINFGALEIGEDGRPHYKDKDKCIECGLCYEICPEIDDLREETKRRISWSEPVGRVIETTIARSEDPRLSEIAMNGGVAKTLLLHLFDMGRIDGAIVTKTVAPFTCKPWLAVTREEIIEAGAFYFDASHGVSLFGEKYSAYPPFLELVTPMAKQGLRRIAFVGRPCQIETMRRMETLGVVPADTIKYHLGLFCMGNFRFGEKEQIEMEKIGGFKWEDVKKVNFKERLQVHLKTKEIRPIEFKKLDHIKRHACQHCGDYSAEFADISFGHLGAPEGWTTVIIRTPVGRAVFADAAHEKLEIFGGTKNREVAIGALSKVRSMSAEKKKMARNNRGKLVEMVSMGE
ncbi:MAG: Coenzyme F420 hydrogenase/dehydrogenase, beta subunit C-terminal domain [Desulfobacteraceae bacterium]|nr:MAG: Coenzyme F420 hydrogenase/dehydrogenase, beta subunit C-terminal domain [Desulfobacteraceae bacterium]